MLYSLTRDNAANNNTFMQTFKESYNKLSYREFIKDIRCIAHIINIIAQDILKDYLASKSSEIQLSQYIQSQLEEEDQDSSLGSTVSKLYFITY